jgi:CheY-like chemotaxis protein
VVEDNAVNRMTIVTYLDEFGLTYEVVSSSGAAVVSLASKDYDLVLMDTAMTDLDGVETTRRIRNMHAPAAKVPIVALLGHGRTADCGAYLAAGMDAYVTKPRSAGASSMPYSPRSSGLPGKSPSSGW